MSTNLKKNAEGIFEIYPFCFLHNNFILIDIPKNASTTLRHTLSFKGRKKYSDVKNKRPTLVIIRNPLYRVVSCFMEMIKVRADVPAWSTETKQSKWFKMYEAQNFEESFRLFLDYIDGNFYDTHVSSQSAWLDFKNLTLEDIDYILMFENLQEDFDEMCRNLKSKWGITINKKLLWDNKTKAQRNTLKKTLINLINSTPAIEEKIKKIYEKDFILYEKALTIKNPIKVNE